MSDLNRAGEATDLGDIMARAACGAAEAQRQLDAEHARTAAGFRALAEDAGLDPDDWVVAALVPPRLRLAAYAVEASVTLATRRRLEASAGVSVAGRVVHALAHARYETARSSAMRLTVHVAAATPQTPF